MDDLSRSDPCGKLTQLVFYLERYGDELEADFQSVYTLNLGELWRSGQHSRMLRLIHQLPHSSRFNAKVANDPEHVEAIIKATEGQPREPYHPPLAGWGTEHEMLASIADKVDHLAAVMIAANGATPPKPILMPRPKTEFGAVEERRKLEAHNALVERMLRPRAPVDSSTED